MKARLVLLTLVLAVLCVVPAAAAPKNPGAVQPIFGDGLSITSLAGLSHTFSDIASYGTSAQTPSAQLNIQAATISGAQANVTIWAEDRSDGTSHSGARIYTRDGLVISGPVLLMDDPDTIHDLRQMLSAMEARITALETSCACQ
jgi:hypothetical protein